MVNRSLEEGSQYEYTLERLVKTPASSVWAIDHYRNDQEVMDRSWCNVDGVRCSLKLWDTFGYHDKNRKFAYRGSDVILLCFSVVKPSSLKNVERFWLPEIKSRCPATPIVLVGTHADLRYLYKNEKYKKMNKGLLYKAVSDEDILPPMSGRDMAASIGAPYYETSVLTKYGIEELFFNVIRATLIERRALKFWNPQLRRVQYPLIQAPMDIPKPELPSIKDPGTAPHEDLSKLLQEDGDVIFDVQGTHFRAHKICLIIAESVFEGIFVHSPKANGRKSLSRQGSSGSDSGRKSEKNGGKEDKENLIGGAPPLPDICLHGTEAMTNGNCRLLNVPGFVKVEEKLWMDPLSLVEEKKTVITMDSELNPLAFQYVLRFWYSGQVPGSCDCLAELRRAAEILMLPTLILMVSNLQTGESYLNHPLESNFYTSRKNKLQSIGLESGRFTDIEFQLEDGVIALHKPILMARCEMMFAMFSANFMESSAEIIPFPGMDVQTFRVLMTYLYLGRLPSLDGSDIVGLFEAADRLCLKHMIKALEYEIVSELLQAEENGDKIVEETLKLIEPAQFHNAVELAGWCLDYVCVNYTMVHRKYFSLLYKLQPDNQRHIAQNKWPPDWYTQEKEYYTMALRDMTPKQMIQQRHQFSRWQRCKSSCLCFGRRSRMINMENEDDAD